MISIEKVLSRTSDSKWPQLIGQSEWEVINQISGSSGDTSALIKFVLEIHGAESLLKNKEKRDIILRKLSIDEAEDLASIMGLKHTDSPLKSLLDCSIPQDSVKEKKMFEFFGVEHHEKEKPIIKPDYESIEPNYPLHDYQKNILIRSTKLIENNENFLIHMPTGSGKTRVAMNLVSRKLMESDKTIILWLAYNEELCDQAADEFTKSWKNIGDRNIKLTRFYEKHDYSPITDGIIIAGLGKLWNKTKDDPAFISKISKKISIIIFDEAHQSVAVTYMNMLKEFRLFNPKCSFIGLSATPGRSKIEEGTILSEFFDSNKVSLNIEGYSSPISFLYDEGYLSRPSFIEINYDGTITQSEKKYISEQLDVPRDILTKLGADNIRNLRIVKTTLDAIGRGNKRIIIFAASTTSAEFISALLTYKGIESFAVLAKTDNAIRSSRIDRFKTESDSPIVLCNYGVLTTGFDAPKINAAIIARPTKSLVLYSQMVGRAIRGIKMGGTATAEIITVVDTDIPGFGSVIQAFRNWDDEWNDR